MRVLSAVCTHLRVLRSLSSRRHDLKVLSATMLIRGYQSHLDLKMT